MFALRSNQGAEKSREGAAAIERNCDGADSPEQSRVWQTLALSRATVQGKLKISQPGDPYEPEADRVADRVMRMATPQSTVTSGGPERPQSSLASPNEIQLKCAPCEEEEEQLQRKAHGTSIDRVDAVPATVHQTVRSPGQHLESATRSFMETRFGCDLGHVRVHDDARAADSAAAVRAAAYTLGSHIVFGAGMYRPENDKGRRLLAHELTHSLQQGGTGLRLQRNTEDFRVTQLQPSPGQRTQGMADRFFFENNRADFRADVATEAAERARLESWATAHAGQHVRLVGRASQEGSEAHNRELARQRAATVRSMLVARGVLVEGTPQIDMTFSTRPVEYRFYRSVEVLVAGSTDPTCSAFTLVQQSQDVTNCDTAFTAALGRAVAIANAGIARIRPTTDPAAAPAPNRDAVLNEQFPAAARTTLLPRFERVVSRLGQVGAAAGHVCNHRCAPGCERPAEAGAGGPVRLCAPFYISGFGGRTMSADERVYTVMHETTHSAVVPGSSSAASVGIDFAYASTRLFGTLEGTEALGNTDSYVTTLLRLARTTSGASAVMATRGSGPTDTLRLATPVGELGDRNRTARRALGFAESWLNYASFWSPNLYDFVAASLAAWSAAGLNGTGHVMLELFAPTFRLHHPGTGALDATHSPPIVAFQTAVAARGFATPATSSHAEVQDRTRIAGIYDRLTRMHRRLRGPLVVNRAPSGSGSWSAGTGLPGLGAEVQLPDTFFTSMTPVERSRHVIRLMALAMTDVGATWVEAYVESADGVHQYRGLGP